MSKKKSYMNKSNLMNEGVLDKIFDLIKRGKTNKLYKKFRKQPDVLKKIKAMKDWEKSLDRRLRKQGINPDKWLDEL